MLPKLLKTVFCAGSALAFMACSFLTSAFQPTPAAEDLAREEQAVYAFLLSKGPVLILENTAIGISEDDPQQTGKYLREGFKDLDNETLNSFMTRNAQPSQLTPNMQLGLDYTLVSTEDLSALTSQPNWNERMAEKYPGTHGYTVFSRVGFNKSLTQAVVYVGSVAGPLMGSGSYFLLEKKAGVWLLKNQIMAWIS